MSKPRKLSRPEIEGLADFFGCRIAAKSVGSSAGVLTYDIYIVHGETKEKIGNLPVNNPTYLYWTNQDWTQVFQRISGISGANLWDQGKRGR
jgi:hypothetical protein